MPEAAQKVVIDLEARVNNAEKALTDVQKQMEQLGDATVKTGEKTESAGKSMAAFYGKIVAGAAALRGFWLAAKEEQQSGAKLDAVLRATGESAGLTRAGLDDIVKGLQDYAGGTKGALQDSAAMLLTFRNINKDVFPETMKLAQDMSAVMGQDMKSSVIQLGKALNDPTQGMGALQRVGVSFTAEQKKQIEYFQKTNQLAKAQGVILQELRVEFGGAAQAMDQTPIGQIESAFDKLKDTMAKIAGVIIPAVSSIVTFISDLIDGISNAGPAIKGVAAVIAIAIGALIGPFSLVIGLLLAIGLTAGKTSEEIDKMTTNSAKSMQEMEVAQDKMNETLDTTINKLSKISVGTAEYKKTIEGLLKQYPDLIKYGIHTASSLDSVRAAQSALNEEMQAKQVLAAAKDFDNLSDALTDAGRNVTKAMIAFKGDPTEANRKAMNANLVVFNNLRKQIESVGKTAGKTGDQIKEAMKFSDSGFPLGNTFKDVLNAQMDVTALMSKNWREMLQGMTADEIVKFQNTLKMQRAELMAAKGLSDDIRAARFGNRNSNQFGLMTDLFTANFDASTNREFALLEEKQRAAVERMRQLMAGYSAASGGGTPGGGGDQKAFFDIEKARRDYQITMAGDYAKSRLQLEHEHDDEVKKINEALFRNALEKTEALDMANKKYMKKRADLEKKIQDEKITKAAEGAQKVLDSVNKVIEGDIIGGLQSGLENFGGPWGKWASFGISAVKSVISIFESESLSEIEYMKKRAEEILSQLGKATGVSDAITEFLGSATEAGLTTGIESAKIKAEQLANIIGVALDDLYDPQKLAAFGENLANEMLGIEKYLTTDLQKIVESTIGFSGKYGSQDIFGVESLIEQMPYMEDQIISIAAEIQKRVRAGMSKSQGEYSFYYLLNKAIEEQNELLAQRKEIYDEILETVSKIQDDTASEKILKMQQELQQIQDDVSTGKRDETESLDDQIALYGDMILALEGVAGANALILSLKKEQYALQQKLNAETDISAYKAGAAGQQLTALVAQLEAIQRQITTGAMRAGTVDTVSQQVGILDAIIANLTAQGAGAEVIGEFEKQRAEILKGLYGETGFAARSGTGTAVGLSIPNVTGGTTNTTTNNTLSINNQTLQTDLIGWIMDELSKKYGVNIINGGA